MSDIPNGAPLPDAEASDGLVAALEEAGAQAHNQYSISAALQRRLDETGDDETGDDEVGWLKTAFDYDLLRRMGDTRQFRGAFREQSNFGVPYPTPIGQVPEEVLALWDSSVARVTEPAATSRLHHLLFEAKYGNVGAHGRAAAEAYVRVGTGSWDPLERANQLHWAATLYRRMGQREAAASLRVQLVALAEEILAGEKSGPGALFHIFEILAYDLEEVGDLPGLLGQARELYGDEPWHAATIIGIEDKVYESDPEQRVRGQRQRVEALLAHADKFPSGLMRATFLEDAARLGDRYGLADLVEQATVERQKIPIEDLGLKPMGAVMEIPAERIDGAVAEILNQETLADALRALVNATPPSGRRELNQAFADHMEQETPFVSLIPTKLIGDDGLGRITAASDEERADEKLARVEIHNLGVGGEVIARVLAGLFKRFQPTPDELVEALSVLPHVSDSVRRSLIRGLALFDAGMVEEAAYVVMPKVEALARDLSREKNVLRFRMQRVSTDGRSTRGQYPQLGALLARLRPWMDPSWERFFHTFLVSPFGPNYRNRLLHGDVAEVNQGTAALTLLCALRLALVPLAEGVTEDGEVIEDEETED